MQKQVDNSHYAFSKYMNKRRWASLWHQLDEVTKLDPERVLEVGPGPGLFKAAAGAIGIRVETLDLDPALKADYVASVFQMPFDDGAFDVVCAFQMLEHLPFEQSLKALREMARVCRNTILISLPDSAKLCSLTLGLPRIGSLHFSIPVPRPRVPVHMFDGQHHWELNKAGYRTEGVVRAFTENAPVALVRTFRVPGNPYHRFIVLSKK